LPKKNAPYLDLDAIDLNGPEGNAYYLMALWKQKVQDAGWSPEEIKEVLNKAMSSDYEHLLKTLKENSTAK
jgi:hypothetical protein